MGVGGEIHRVGSKWRKIGEVSHTILSQYRLPCLKKTQYGEQRFFKFDEDWRCAGRVGRTFSSHQYKWIENSPGMNPDVGQCTILERVSLERGRKD